MEVNLATMFVDVCDSTRVYEAVGNVQATAMIQGLLQRFRGLTTTGRGKVVKSLGDGLLCVFPEADSCGQTADAMIALVDELRGRAQGPMSLRVRIGMHYGSVVIQEEDIFGDSVNVTARVQSLASPGEVLLTEDLRQQLSAPLRNRCRLQEATVVKGKTVPIKIHRFMKDDAADDSFECTIIGDNHLLGLGSGKHPTLRLWYRGKELSAGITRPKLTIGRHENSDIVIQARQASRNHGSIEYVRESFMLTDHSSNGTFLFADGSQPILLRRDTARLVGSGWLGIGAVGDSENQDQSIRFVCAGTE